MELASSSESISSETHKIETWIYDSTKQGGWKNQRKHQKVKKATPMVLGFSHS